MSPFLVMLKILLAFSVGSCISSPHDHRYSVGDRVPLFVNKVGPLNSPSETYQYYELPFCRPDPLIEKRESLGEVLNGDRLMNSLYELKFHEDRSVVTLCRKKLKVNEVAKFRDAISNDFYFQMYYDDLPLWGFIGKIEREGLTLGEEVPKYYLFKHVQFDALYNGDQIIEIGAFSDPNHTVDISQDTETEIEFTYSVSWTATVGQFKTRMDKYTRASSLQVNQKIHWFSIVNSISVLVLLMGLFTVLFMRHLKNDLRKGSSGDEEEDKEAGWKYIHADVFRSPQNIPLFCAILGVGTQLVILVCFLFALVFLGVLYPYNRGALCTSIVFGYALTSVVAGYTAASFHCQFSGTGWEKSVRLAGVLYLGPLSVVVSILNTVAISYGATAAIPFGTIIVILLVYMLVSMPLLALGGVLGYRFRSEFQAPCATKRFVREIPQLDWYKKTPCQMFLGGFLSSSATILELHQVYASLWGYKICTLTSIIFVMFIILVMLTAIVNVALTYIQLSAEDHQWWWRSVLCGGSTAMFMFAYSIYFYTRSNMSGILQLSFFVGYNACLCYAFFLMLGSISFCASFIFVRRIYHAVKSE